MKNELTKKRCTMGGTEVSMKAKKTGGVIRRGLGLLMALALVAGLSACGNGQGNAGSSSDSEAAAGSASQEISAVNTEGPWTVGIAQLAQHPSLDMASKGFEDALKEELGDRVTIDLQNASGETANVSTIINTFVSQNVSLILANATAPLQAAASATSEIPILGTSVTDYASALELTDFQGVVGTNVSGTTDLAPFDQQVEIFTDWFKPGSKVGIIYSSSEANSAYQVSEMTKRLEEAGFVVTPYSFTDSNDVTPVVTQAVAASDVLYMPTDNTAASNAEGIANIVLPAKKPMVAAEAQSASVLGVASVAIDYYELGQMTGHMAAKVLTGKEKISEMPIQSASGVKKMVNAKNAKALGLTIPEGYEVIKGTEAE